MLSILIPTFNYDTFPLVENLWNQIIVEKIPFEILVGDDKSTDLDIIKKNKKINSLEYCSYITNNINLGRGHNINELAKKANFEWLLILDCDVLPSDLKFIKKYLHQINLNSFTVFFGGLIYHLNKPNNDEMLRWIYGHKRESVVLEKRKINPYQTTLTSNILLKKQILESYPFPSQIKNYGFEDLVFILELKKNNIKIEHVDNPVYHMNLEKSIIFIKKFESSLRNLKILIDSNMISNQDAKFSKIYIILKKYKLSSFFALSFDFFKSFYLWNLTSKYPLLFVFDLYRLSYYCKLNFYN